MVLEFIPLSRYEDLILLIVRIILGILMIYYGSSKVKDFKSNAKDFEKMGLKPGIFWGSIIAILEFFGGFLIILGLYVEVVAVLFAFEMISGTIWKITKTNKPFTDWSYDLLLLAIALILATFGAGNYAFG